MNPHIDLRQLAVRNEDGIARRSRRRRPYFIRYVLPAVVVLGFVAVLAWAARDSLLPAQPVTITPVLSTRAEIQVSGTPLFQAAGWVEPRPTPVMVTALTEGVVQQLLVVEGQEVKAEDPVATLVQADAQFALRTAEAELALRQAEWESSCAVRDAAKVNLEQPVHLQGLSAEADAMVAKMETELATLPFQIKAAEAKQKLARLSLESKSKVDATGVLPELHYRQAESELETAAANLQELTAKEPRLKRELAALGSKRDAMRKRLELKTEEIRQYGEAEAKIKACDASLKQAQVALESARLRLERTTVRAPMAGRVLGLVARPGMRLMGLAGGTLQESSTVVTLYDPARLQVRADVRLEDVPRVTPGQPVKIETPAAPEGALDGTVLFSTSQADIQKNTLQVKVAINAPPAFVKPDMLVQVTFLAPPTTGKPAASTEQLRLMIPRQLVEPRDGGNHVWIADQVGRVARLRPIKLGLGQSDDLVEVAEGLSPADKLIASGRAGLSDGQRIRVTGEDAGVGASSTGPATRGARLQRRAQSPPGSPD
jgi:RND family efflux transporter MFP subunit